MEKLEKGYCFEGPDQSRFLIVGDAISQESGQLVYLCQELTGKYRLMVWTAQAISGGSTASLNAGDYRKSSGLPPYAEEDSGEVKRTADEKNLQSLMIRFLEASSCSEKLELLDLMKGKVSESMLESMAISMDYELGGGSVEEKYYALERFLKTRRRYESNRLR